jgi:hypothetical protein
VVVSRHRRRWDRGRLPDRPHDEFVGSGRERRELLVRAECVSPLPDGHRTFLGPRDAR